MLVIRFEAQVFNYRPLRNKLENGILCLPDPELLPNNDNHNNTGVVGIYYT